MPKRSTTPTFKAISGKQHMELCEVEKAYVITFKGKPFRLRHMSEDVPSWKYDGMFFTEEGRARNKVKKLNQIFNTTDISYKEI